MRAQRGVTLIELILVVGLLAMITILNFYEKQADLEQARARIVGSLIFQYNNAVRNALAQNIPASSVTYLGSSWLKSSACGGMLTPGTEYLPCDFPLATAANPVPFGRLSFTTTVAVSGTPPNRKFTATTSTSAFSVGEPGAGLKVRADLSGLAVLAAASAIGTGVQASAGGVSPVAATSDSSYASSPVTGVITFVSSNNASNDVWLRTDGSNSMHKTLNFDSGVFADRQITGASRIQNLAGQALFLGSGSGMTAVTAAGVVVDSNAEIMGSFRVRNNVQVDGDTGVLGNIWTSGVVSATGNVASSANVTAAGAVVGQYFSDGNDGNYYVDPNGGSQMNTVYANTYVDRNDPNYYVDPNGTSRQNAVLANTSYASVFYDINNTGYYVQPANTSRLNAVQSNVEYSGVFYDINNTGFYLQPSGANRLNGIWSNGLINYGSIEVGQFIQLDAVSNEGWGCAPSGMLSRTADGSSLSCVNGIWRKAGGSAPTCYHYTIPGYAAYDVTVWACPAGMTKMGWDSTGENWRTGSDGTIIGQNDYAVVFCCQF
ncbi:pilus assembly FimT family protein [Pseudomonas serbica]|uniref:pilus assembly FimT family protein n=1 Tax=Pseudomonas serbica TaxID=2965074 RepID=UPI00237B4321|nr:type II secretion system protein [Pseudomonas serbica]